MSIHPKSAGFLVIDQHGIAVRTAEPFKGDNVATGTVTWFNAWAEFLIFWLLPLATVLQVIVRWGAICEHKSESDGIGGGS